MSCENNSNHDQANYCAECSTCHDCLADALDADCKAIKLLQAENAKLKEELEAVKAGLHSEKDINKIKADAIVAACVECEVTPQFGSNVMGTIRVADLLEHANKVENGQ